MAGSAIVLSSPRIGKGSRKKIEGDRSAGRPHRRCRCIPTVWLAVGCLGAAESLFPMRSGQQFVRHAIPSAFDSTSLCVHSEFPSDSPRSRRKAERTPRGISRCPRHAAGIDRPEPGHCWGSRELFTVGWNRKPHAVLAGFVGSSRWVKLSYKSLGERLTWAI